MKPSGGLSVMTDHAPAEVATDSDLMKLHRALEYFPTPPWAARAGGEFVNLLDPPTARGFDGWTCWEPACGEGHMAHALNDYFASVFASDIHPHGYADVLDFLDPSADVEPQVDWVMTNPPFGEAAAFVRRGLQFARRGVAVLCRSGWRDTEGRYPMFYGGRDLPACDLELPFFDRVNMNLGRWVVKSSDKGGSSATPYSWFIWFKPEARPRRLVQAQAAMRGMLPLSAGGIERRIPRMGERALVSIGIPPGTKARLTRPDDARLFGWKGESGGLLGEVEP